MDDRLTKLQWDFLENHIQASRHDFYRTKKVKLKGKFIEDGLDASTVDDLLDEWVIDQVLHGDPGDKPYQCQCGRRVRHLYVVKHRRKAITLKLGSTCYKDYIGIDAEKFVEVSALNQTLVAEREVIIDRYDIGHIELMKFLLDYEDLDPLYREQLSLGLPLSYKQETKAYKDLKVEDESSLVTVKESIRKLNKHQLSQLNALTSEARLTVVARLRDGRILGVLDEVLEAAPELFAERGTPYEHSPNRLVDRLSERFELEGVKGQWRQDPVCLKDINSLLTLVESEVLEPQQLVMVGRHLLTDRQRDFWGGHTSFSQKVEITRHLLAGSNMAEVTLGMKLPNKLRQQIDQGLPLTNTQMAIFESLT